MKQRKRKNEPVFAYSIPITITIRYGKLMKKAPSSSSSSVAVAAYLFNTIICSSYRDYIFHPREEVCEIRESL